MEIKESLAENAKTGRQKYALLLGLAILPCAMLVGLYLLSQNIGDLGTSSHQNVVELSSSEVQIANAYNAQSAFDRQIQAWFSVLLLGDEPQHKNKYWNNFLSEEAAVHEAIATMQVAAASAHEESKIANLKLIQDFHQGLGGKFRDGLAKYPSSHDNNAAFKIDRMVSGWDTYLAAQLEKISDDAKLEYKNLAARVVAVQSKDIENVQVRVELNLIVITALLLLELFLIMRTSGTLQKFVKID